MRSLHGNRRLHALALAAGVSLVACGSALADRIKHPTAVFAGLDKITGRIIAFDVATDETVQFGSLQITPRVCYTRPQTEAPQTTSFVEVDELQEDRKFRRIFSGWMFASSPGLHGVEHPVYDVWLTECKGGTEVIKTEPEIAEDSEPPPNADVRNPRAGGPQQPPKPKETKRRVDQPPGAPGGLPGAQPLGQPGAPMGAPLPPVGLPQASQPLRPPADIPEAPRRAPTRRYYPQDMPGAGPNPAGN